MAKNAMIAVRLDEELKDDAQETLEAMGLTMSMAIEMFLRQVVERGRLPFPVGREERDDAEAAAEKERRERDFWRAYILWNFQAWPHFDSSDMERRAADDLEWNGRGAGDTACSYLVGGPDGSIRDLPEDRLAAYLDVSAAQSLLSDAKELIYWALDMERTFVPSLAGRYSPDSDAWRYLHLQEQRRMREWEEGEGEDEDWDEPPARGVVGARYFGVDGCGGEG